MLKLWISPFHNYKGVIYVVDNMWKNTINQKNNVVIDFT
jgi:hypothetical protein